MTWTDARIAELSRLWAAGVSASGIAEALGEVSRSAVLGKLHRLNLLGTRKSASAPQRYRASTTPASPARAAGPFAPTPPRDPSDQRLGATASWRAAAFTPLPGSAPRPWLTRGFGECAFPVGEEGRELLSCCAPIKGRDAYCAAHRAVVFKPAAPSARAAEERQWTQIAERWAA